MSQTEQLIREYTAILSEQHRLEQRKQELRALITGSLKEEALTSVQCPFGSAVLTKRHSLTPRPEKILTLLKADDILPFARFTPKKVRDLLVPTYGRERLLEAFDVETTEVLMVRAERGA